MLGRLFRRLGRLSSISLTLAIVAAVVAMFVSEVTVLDQFELRTYDLRFRSRGPVPASSAIVIAMVDEKSLATEGRWPWPRAKIAALVDRLSEAGAKVIAFDIGFLEPDENSELALLGRLDRAVVEMGLASPPLSAFLSESRAHADNDRALADAIGRSRAAVVLGYFFHMSDDESEYRASSEEEIARQFAAISSSKYPLVTYRGAAPDAAVIPNAYAPESNLPMLTAVADSSGYFSVKQDSDGVVRWMPLVIAGRDELFPPLSILAAWHYLDEPQLMVKMGPYGIEGLTLGDRRVPTDDSGRLLVDYVGPPKSFPHVSIGDVLAGSVPAETFRDKLVFVGADATGIYDARTTPFSPVHPGVEIHATVADNLITGRFISRPGWSEIYDTFAIVVLGLLAGYGVGHLGALSGLLFASLLFAGHLLVARLLFVRYGVWLNVVYPLLALSSVYIATTVRRFVGEQRERRRLRNAFSQYVSPVVVDEIVKDPERLHLGGEEKILTVLFSDLQGFTSYSERYTPQQMIELLSEYYARMTERVFARGGTLKEYVGDEMMAIFGAPIGQYDHAVRACYTALEMREERRAMSEEWATRGRPPLKARTGINTGNMLVGNLGSKYRFSYGVLGDHVNLGSRLEGLNKQYGTEILIGENTAELLGESFVLREVDRVRAVGKQESTGIYELVAAAGSELPPAEAAVLRAYAAGLAAYRERRWKDALDALGDALAQRPGDGPSLVMVERCRSYLDVPPSEDWDGVFVATSK